MISSPFPPGIGFATQKLDSANPELLLLEEAQLLGGFKSPTRRLSFTAGRLAAHSAYRNANLPVAPTGSGAEGQPLWPAGAVGAITHCQDLAAAAVAPTTLALGLGIDLEPIDRRISPAVRERLCTPSELATCAKTDNHSILRTFSAKESIFKALYPQVQRYFGFHAVSIEWYDDAFVALLEVDLTQQLHKGLRLHGGVLTTARWMMTYLLLTPTTQKQD